MARVPLGSTWSRAIWSTFRIGGRRSPEAPPKSRTSTCSRARWSRRTIATISTTRGTTPTWPSGAGPSRASCGPPAPISVRGRRTIFPCSWRPSTPAMSLTIGAIRSSSGTMRRASTGCCWLRVARRDHRATVAAPPLRPAAIWRGGRLESLSGRRISTTPTNVPIFSVGVTGGTCSIAPSASAP